MRIHAKSFKQDDDWLCIGVAIFTEQQNTLDYRGVGITLVVVLKIIRDTHNTGEPQKFSIIYYVVKGFHTCL